MKVETMKIEIKTTTTTVTKNELKGSEGITPVSQSQT